MTVSVIIPCYNSEKTIERCLNSVFHQTVIPSQIIVVDDCSTDDTQRILSVFKNKITYKRLENNLGPGNARNEGIKASNSNFIAFLDSDDFWEKEKIEIQLKFMIENKYDASCTGVDYFKTKSQGQRKIFKKIPEKIYDKNSIKNLCKENTIITSSVMIRKSSIKNHLFLNIKNRQDLLFWTNLIKEGINFYGIQKPLVNYDLSSKGISSNKLKMLLANYKIFSIILNSRLLAFKILIINTIRNIFLRIK
jgi:teichuronic acid biosynthesis glycosyltransferase TuaG